MIFRKKGNSIMFKGEFNLKTFFLVISLSLFPMLANATFLTVSLVTGSDDLRGGNTAYISLIALDGRRTSEQPLSRGMAAGAGALNIPISFPEVSWGLSDIASIQIRHDGNPRSGHPFDTYDNWNLQSLIVDLANVRFELIGRLYDSSRDLQATSILKRFTGESRVLTLPLRTAACEPDYVVSRIISSTISGRTITDIRNNGLCSGTSILVTCTSVEYGRVANVSYSGTIGSSSEIGLSLPIAPRGTMRCSVRSGFFGTPETVTTNNRSTRFFSF